MPQSISQQNSNDRKFQHFALCHLLRKSFQWAIFCISSLTLSISPQTLPVGKFQISKFFATIHLFSNSSGRQNSAFPTSADIHISTNSTCRKKLAFRPFPSFIPLQKPYRQANFSISTFSTIHRFTNFTGRQNPAFRPLPLLYLPEKIAFWHIHHAASLFEPYRPAKLTFSIFANINLSSTLQAGKTKH